MATEKFSIDLKVGQTFGLRKKIFQVRDLIVREGVKAFGPQWKYLMENPLFTKSGIVFGHTPQRLKSTLGAYYAKAWRERYQEIATSYRNTEATLKWKKANQGKEPYTSGDKINYETAAWLTGGLFERIEAAFEGGLGDTPQIKFANIGIQGGFIFDATAFPHRKSGDWVDSVSYVVRFINYLVARGVIEESESLIDFSDQRWQEIAQAMNQYAQDVFLEGIAKKLRSNDI